MKDLNYYKINLTFSIITIILLFVSLKFLTGIWLTTHIYLLFAFLIITIIGIYGLGNQKDWSPVVFLLLFASQAIDGFYLLSISKNFVFYTYVIISIIALYKSAINADIYKKIRKKRFFKVKNLPSKDNNNKSSVKKSVKKSTKKSTKKIQKKSISNKNKLQKKSKGTKTKKK